MGFIVTSNIVGKDTECALCDDWFDPPVGFAACLTSGGYQFVCDACLELGDADLSRLIAGSLLDEATSDDPWSSHLAWRDAFRREGYLDPYEEVGQ